MLKRHIDAQLNQWFDRDGRKPLVIRGARQVGKSTSVRHFAHSRGLKLHEANLERTPYHNEMFNNLDVDALLAELEFSAKAGSFEPGKSLLFLDEIQAAPGALKALRYIHEEHPHIAVIAAGSLLEFTLANHNFSMPVGRIEYLFMGPMSFSEYLEAKKETQLQQLLRNFDFSSSVPHSAHRRLVDILREFFIIGGMPEAVSRYVANDRLEDALRVQSSIVETYRDDFAKYARGNELHNIHRVYDFIPSAVGEKVKYSRIDPNTQSRDLKKAIDGLTKARVLTAVHHSSSSGIPLKSGMNEKVFKLYLLDVGLMNRMCGVEHISTDLLGTADDFINKGGMAEQFIAQHLLYLNRSDETPRLYYWLRDGRANNAEVDFVIQAHNRIVPIEVKAGKSGTLKSLHQFVLSRKVAKALRFDLNPPTRMTVRHQSSRGDRITPVEFELISLPLYLVEHIHRLLGEAGVKS
ncbi:MAG TPA: ATP-binding protein [Candidatus Aminicenantes bacterium]|nr:ATP-binding protein [Candidatus Aminicenantes bacterium]